MSAEHLWGFGLGTVLLVALLLGLVYFQKRLRDRLFPGGKGKDRGEAMAQLLLLQTRLEEEAGREEVGGEEDDGEEGNRRAR